MPSERLSSAYRLHYDKRFAEACSAYHTLLAQSPTPEEAAAAAQQLQNLRDYDAGPDAGDAEAAKLSPRRGSRGPARTADGSVQNRGDLQGDEGR